MAEHASAIEIQARPDDVFDYLVTEAGLTAWLGRNARLDAQPGGELAIDVAGFPVRGRFREIDRPRRVVMTWGFAGSDELPPGASTLSFELSATPHGTSVELRHADLPEAQVVGHIDGWANFLPRLARACASGDAGPDDWRPQPDER